ncbi:unnamed protein product [Clonostachys rosea f. rosea IK726]|uniref:Uncharacterized protein n=1 Tax=Clonostachys rosea f. rosea IK726 TaxID=1349383 RepID=A0ACA9UC26_BIOOC|nr:unnamed protein product [Clonostachys rosea f. rosea IK726]
MLGKSILIAIIGMSMTGFVIAGQDAKTAPASATLPISYGKCYRIQNQAREFLGSDKLTWGYQLFKPLSDSEVYQICQHRVDGACQYDSVRAVRNAEDFFIWDFVGATYAKKGNLLAANDPTYYWGRFYPGASSFRNFFHFQGEAECGINTNPCAIRTSGTNKAAGHRIMEDEKYLRTTRDNSTRLLWYHEVSCPES